MHPDLLDLLESNGDSEICNENVATVRFDRVLVIRFERRERLPALHLSYIAVCVRAKLKVFLHLVNFCISIEYSPNTRSFTTLFP